VVLHLQVRLQEARALDQGLGEQQFRNMGSVVVQDIREALLTQAGSLVLMIVRTTRSVCRTGGSEVGVTCPSLF
jgi:ribosomal protein L14